MNQKTDNGMEILRLRRKWLIGGLIVIAAIIYLVVSTTKSQTQYFLTVDEILLSKNEYLGQRIRISGAVLGETIEYDAQKMELTFTVVHIPGDHQQILGLGGMSAVLHTAVNDPDLNRLQVKYHGLLPDLLQHEAQAIMTGFLIEDGIFSAEEILFKCPSKYEEQGNQ